MVLVLSVFNSLLMIITLLSCALPWPLSSEGPLLLKGQYYLKLTGQKYDTGQVFDRGGIIWKSYNHFSGNRFLLEGDVGLDQNNTVSLIAGYTSVNEELDGKTEGFSDLELTLKHAFIRKDNFLCCLEGKLYIPLQDEYRPAVRFGTSGLGAMLFVALRENFHYYPLMVSFGAGFDVFQKTAEDVVKMRVRAAICPLNALAFRTTVKLDYGLKNGRLLPNRSLVDYNPNYRLLRGEIELIYQPSRCWQVAIGFFDNI